MSTDDDVIDMRVLQLRSSVSATRALIAHKLADEYVGEAMEPLRELLDDRAPFVFHHAGKLMVAEVRAAALNALQLMYKQINEPPDFGAVEVRKAMTADEIQEALDAADASEVGRATKQAEEFLAAHVVPANEKEGKLLLAYRILQQLGKIEYRLERVDLNTYMTPLQAEVSASQLVSDRPKPHVRFSSHNDRRLLGYYYPEDGQWILDFAEDAEARDVERYLRSILTLEESGVPRVVQRVDGSPKTNPDGSFVLDGVAPFDGDPTDVLFSVSAFLATEANADVVC